MSTGAIVGLVVGILVGVTLLALFITYTVATIRNINILDNRTKALEKDLKELKQRILSFLMAVEARDLDTPKQQTKVAKPKTKTPKQ